jgi:hypothetical protein
VFQDFGLRRVLVGRQLSETRGSTSLREGETVKGAKKLAEIYSQLFLANHNVVVLFERRYLENLIPRRNHPNVLVSIVRQRRRKRRLCRAIKNDWITSKMAFA